MAVCPLSFRLRFPAGYGAGRGLSQLWGRFPMFVLPAVLWVVARWVVAEFWVPRRGG